MADPFADFPSAEETAKKCVEKRQVCFERLCEKYLPEIKTSIQCAVDSYRTFAVFDFPLLDCNAMVADYMMDKLDKMGYYVSLKVTASSYELNISWKYAIEKYEAKLEK